MLDTVERGPYNGDDAPVAQWIEQLPSKQTVGGSIPSRGVIWITEATGNSGPVALLAAIDSDSGPDCQDMMDS